MQNGTLNTAEKIRLWLFERALPPLFVIVLPVALGLNHWLRESERRQRDELVATLNGLSHRYTVTIDSKDASDPAGVVEALKTITKSQPHHSSPADPRLVQIRSENAIVQLCVERDSQVPTEYWVSTPRKGGCGEGSFGDPYFGVLRTDRLTPYWDRVAK